MVRINSVDPNFYADQKEKYQGDQATLNEIWQEMANKLAKEYRFEQDSEEIRRFASLIKRTANNLFTNHHGHYPNEKARRADFKILARRTRQEVLEARRKMAGLTTNQ